MLHHRQLRARAGTSCSAEEQAPLIRFRCWRSLAISANVVPTSITTLSSLVDASPRSNCIGRLPQAPLLEAWFLAFVEFRLFPSGNALTTAELEFSSHAKPFPVIASWNINWLRNLHSPQGRSKLNEINRVLRMGCVICLQETHWRPGDAEAVAAATSATVVASSSPSFEKAGVAILVDRCSPWKIQ